MSNTAFLQERQQQRQCDELKRQTTRRPRFPQPNATYKRGYAPNIPTRNVLVENRCSLKHSMLWKHEEWCRIVVDDRSSSDIGQRKEWCEIFGFDVDNEHDYNAECMNNTASLQGRQQQRQWSELKRWKQREDQDFHSPTMPLTKLVPLLTFQVEISALNADAW